MKAFTSNSRNSLENYKTYENHRNTEVAKHLHDILFSTAKKIPKSYATIEKK